MSFPGSLTDQGLREGGLFSAVKGNEEMEGDAKCKIALMHLLSIALKLLAPELACI